MFNQDAALVVFKQDEHSQRMDIFLWIVVGCCLMFFFCQIPVYMVFHFVFDYWFRLSIKMPDGASLIFPGEKNTCLNTAILTYLINWDLSLVCNAFFIHHFASMNTRGFVITTPSLSSILREEQWRCNQQDDIWGCA